MWTEIKRTYGNGRVDRRRTEYGIRFDRGANSSPQFLIPAGKPFGEYARILSDGNGKLAFVPARSGFKVRQDGAKYGGKCRQITIPRDFAKSLPRGTHDAIVTEDGDKLILDLSQFAA